jgi:hypothetical protein
MGSDGLLVLPQRDPIGSNTDHASELALVSVTSLPFGTGMGSTILGLTVADTSGLLCGIYDFRNGRASRLTGTFTLSSALGGTLSRRASIPRDGDRRGARDRSERLALAFCSHRGLSFDRRPGLRRGGDEIGRVVVVGESDPSPFRVAEPAVETTRALVGACGEALARRERSGE